MNKKRKYRIHKGKLTAFIFVVCFVVFMVNVAVNFAKYPEEYITPWKYQMENDLAKGDEEALEYYNRVYVSNGKYLFGDKYINENANENDYLDMRTVVNVEISESGVLLETNDGSGYYLEGNYLND